MILQALNRYYERMEQSGDALAPQGWIDKPIDYIIRLDRAGKCLGLVPPPLAKRRKRERGTVWRVPSIGKQALKHTNSGDDANLLWDNAAFVLGVGKNGEKKRTAFVSVIQHYFRDVDDAGIDAVCSFISAISADSSALENFLAQYPDSREDLLSGQPTVSFQLSDDSPELVCQRRAVRAAYQARRSAHREGSRRQCLVTGEPDVIAVTHDAIKGVWGGQTSGGYLISFNERAFESYGNERLQGLNAPVGARVASTYTTALNYLLRDGSRQRLQVGDASAVFWSQEADEIEEGFGNVFGESDDPNHTEEVRAVLEAIHAGRFDGGRGDNRFYVLGLAPNAARISVRFWHAEPVRSIARRIGQWFEDIDIAHGPNEPEFPSLFRLLTACAAQNKADNIPPNLGGEIMRSILSGGVFPATWLNAAVQRCRAEQRVTRLRAASIKAYLNRSIRRQLGQEGIQPMLDSASTNTAYRLGRLFAALEKVQEEASPGLNVTIRERFYGAASSTPVSVFTTLLRLKNHHVAKLESKGRATYFEKLIGEIVGGIADFPAHLALQDQGRFALGYYHQRQAFFTKP